MGEDLHILQHSLGVDQYGQGDQYRNRFITGEGSTDYPFCMDLVRRGLMVRRDGNPLTGGDDLFTVTDEGKRWMAENSPAAPKLTAGQKRYRDYLNYDGGMSFIEYCRMKSAQP